MSRRSPLLRGLYAAGFALALCACDDGGSAAGHDGGQDAGADGHGDGQDGSGDGDPADAGPDVCRVRGQAAALSIVDRSILGSAVDYRPDETLRTREHALIVSQRARREMAWQVVARALAEVKLPAGSVPVEGASVPAFQTWHGKDDLTRIFNRAYPELSPAERKARAPFPDGALARTFAWNDHAIDDFPEWTAERIAAYRNAIDDASKVAGLSSVTRVAYSPGASEHMLASYGEVLDCGDKDPGDVSPPPTVQTDTLLDRTLAVPRCKDYASAPIALGAHDTLTVEFTPEASADVPLVAEFRAEFADEPTRCELDAERLPCTFTGKGELTLTAATETTPLGGHLVVTRRRESRPFAPCLRSAFPSNAVVVKADWRRAELGIQLPVYDTSAEGLGARLAGPEPSWTTPDRTANPGPGDIYTATLPNGNVFRLAALHVMTKELDHWVWVTLWWSDRPDEDFGADRPASIPAAFRHYKMCATVAFAEQDADPQGGYATSHPSLGRALAASHAGKGGPTWCSNPYLELGDGNADTNCIGCHQHAGTLVRAETVLGDHARYPAHGRTLLRQDFLSDYVYALTTGDSLGALFRQTETHFSDP